MWSTRTVTALGLLLTLSLQAVPPSHDSRTNALPLTGTSGVVATSLGEATVEPEELSWIAQEFGPDRAPRGSVWYQWTAPAEGGVLLSIPPAAHPGTVAFWTTAESWPVMVSPTRAKVIPVESQTTYTLGLAELFAAPELPAVAFQFFPRPENDRWEKRQALPTTGQPIAGTSVGARTGNWPRAALFGPVVWYEWTAPTNGWAQLLWEPLRLGDSLAYYSIQRAAAAPPGPLAVAEPLGYHVKTGERLWVLVPDSFGTFQLGFQFTGAQLKLSTDSPLSFGLPLTAEVIPTAWDGPVREVELRLNGIPVGNRSQAPYQWTWPSLPVGSHVVEAALIHEGGEVRRLEARTVVVQEPNDAFANASVLSGTTATAEFHPGAASAELDEPSHLGRTPGKTVWWSWTPPHSGRVNLKVDAEEFSYRLLTAYRGTNLNQLVPVAGQDNGQLTFQAVAGEPYRIVVSCLGQCPPNDLARLSLELLPPAPNDDFAQATALVGSLLTVEAEAASATAELGEWFQDPPLERSLWWTWQAPADGFLGLIPESPAGLRVECFEGTSLLLLRPLSDALGGNRALRVRAGVTHPIRGRVWGDEPIRFQLKFTGVPDNDSVQQATELSSLPVRVEGNLFSASIESPDPSNLDGELRHNVWYRWTPAVSQTVALNLEPNWTGLSVRVLRGPNPGSLEFVPWDGARLNAESGQTYWFSVCYRFPATSDLPFVFELLPPPANDDWSQAQEIPSAGGWVSGHTFGATAEPGEYPHFSVLPPSGQVWYRWTASSNGLVTLSCENCASVSLATGTSLGTLTDIPQADYVSFSNGWSAPFNAVAGTTYWIGVGSPEVANASHFRLAVATTRLELELQPATEPLQEGDSLTARVSGVGTETALVQLFGPGLLEQSSLRPLTEPHRFPSLPPGDHVARAWGISAAGLPHLSPAQAFRVAPANDSFAQSAPLTLPVRLTGFLHGAGAEPNEPFPELAAEPRSRWWQWTAPESGRVVVGGAGLLGVYTGSDLSSLVPDFTSGSRPPFAFEAIAGTTYHLQVAPDWLSFPGFDPILKEDFELNLSWLPPNDDFANRAPLTGSAAVLVARHSAASAESDEPWIGPLSPQRSVWFSWTAPADGWLELRNPEANPDHLAAVYQGTSLAQLTLLGSAWNGRERIQVPVTAGTTYALALLSQNTALTQPDARWELHWFPVLDNDSFANRRRLTGPSAAWSDHTLGTTRELGEPEIRYGPPDARLQHTIWYEWTAPNTGWAQWRIGAESGLFYSRVFQGTSLANLLVMREPEATYWGTNLFFRVEAGRTYSLMVGSPAGESGSFTAELVSPTPPANDAFAQAQFVASDAAELVATVTNATLEPGEPAVSDPNFGTVWFRWKSPGRGFVQIHDPMLPITLWQGTSLEQLTTVSRTEVGAEYWIRVEGNQLYTTTVPIRYGPSPVNDDFANALEVSGPDVRVEGDSEYGTFEPGEHEDSSLWWRWTAPESGTLKLAPEGSTYVELRRGTGPAEAVSMRLASWDSIWNTSTVAVERGVTYHFRSINRGPVRFQLRFRPHPAAEITGITSGPARLSLAVPGTLGRWFELQHSTNLQTWNSLGLQWSTGDSLPLPIPEEDLGFYRVVPR